jgi:hypothetical protein
VLPEIFIGPLPDDVDPEKMTGIPMPGARLTTSELLRR